MINRKGYGFDPLETLNLPNEIVFMAARGCHNEIKMQEHLIEVTLMGYHGNTLLSTIIAPRTFVTIINNYKQFVQSDM